MCVEEKRKKGKKKKEKRKKERKKEEYRDDYRKWNVWMNKNKIRKRKIKIKNKKKNLRLYFNTEIDLINFNYIDFSKDLPKTNVKLINFKL